MKMFQIKTGPVRISMSCLILCVLSVFLLLSMPGCSKKSGSLNGNSSAVDSPEEKDEAEPSCSHDRHTHEHGSSESDDLHSQEDHNHGPDETGSPRTHDENGASEHGHSHEEDAREQDRESADGTHTHAGHSHGLVGSEHSHGEAQCDAHGSHGPVGESIDIPLVVRQNLGITFAKVEKRPVRRTLRLPGQFELRPSARREYRTMLAGRVKLHVGQYERVDMGTLLFTLNSPEWKQLQQNLVETFTAMIRSHSSVDSVKAELTEAEKSIEFLSTRIENLKKANVRQVELEAELAEKQNALPRLRVALGAAQTDSDSDHLRYAVLLNHAASVSGIPAKLLDSTVGHHHPPGSPLPEWSTISEIAFVSEVSGIVDKIDATDNGWVETGNLVLDTLEPADIRFHADALQGDIVLLKDGLPGRIVPPPGGSIDQQDTADVEIQVGIRAHPDQRTIPVYAVPELHPEWAKAGVTGFMDVFLDGPEKAEIAIPKSCIIQDGLKHVFFLRDSGNPDVVYRVEARLGATDGNWVAVDNALHVGDEVVLKGIYPLMLASGKGDKSKEPVGHFHSDGTFHAADEH